MSLARRALKPRRQNAPRPAWKAVEAFKAWLRKRPCLLEGHRAGGCGLAEPPRKSPVEAAHVDHAGGKGMGTKVADAYCLPLCQRHHDEQGGRIGTFRQRGGWKSFELKYGFDAVAEAEALWRLWPGRVKWEAKHG